MASQASTPLWIIEIERRRVEALRQQQRDMRAFAESIARIQQQLEVDRALLETSRRILEESRDLKRRIAETLAGVRRVGGPGTTPAG